MALQVTEIVPQIEMGVMNLTFRSDRPSPIQPSLGGTQSTLPMPVTVTGNRVSFDTRSMSMGQWYEFQKNNKKYVAVMKQPNVIDIYRIRE
jgi:hypothetical protein